MRSDQYVHPEFGLLSPTPRLRRELRMAFFSVMLGIVIGAATVIALSVNKSHDDAQVSGLSSASVISEHPTEGLLGNEVKDPTSNSNGTKAQVNSENDKPTHARVLIPLVAPLALMPAGRARCESLQRMTL